MEDVVDYFGVTRDCGHRLHLRHGTEMFNTFVHPEGAGAAQNFRHFVSTGTHGDRFEYRGRGSEDGM